MDPHWTGVNYGVKGFAKTICHDERQAEDTFFFSSEILYTYNNNKRINFQALSHI